MPPVLRVSQPAHGAGTWSCTWCSLSGSAIDDSIDRPSPATLTHSHAPPTLTLCTLPPRTDSARAVALSHGSPSLGASHFNFFSARATPRSASFTTHAHTQELFTGRKCVLHRESGSSYLMFTEFTVDLVGADVKLSFAEVYGNGNKA
jgi:hypothetical protein